MRGTAFWRQLLVLLAAVAYALAPVRVAAAPLGLDPAWKVQPAPGLSAGGAVLLDWQTGRVLYQKDGFRRRDPASTTKVLTAIIALERGKLDDQVTVSKRAAYTPGSSLYIKPGDKYSLHDLLHGLLLRSGNDASVAIAEHIAGSVEAFAQLMNAKAREIGALKSHFTNPHGLTDAKHYTTAYDLAVISRYALRHPTFAAIVSQRVSPLTYENLHRDVILHNTNRLLNTLPGADGVKTGTTAAAGACLVASATRDDQKLVAVVLHAGNRWNDAARLLEWGFGNFRLAYAGHAGEVLLQAPLHGGKQPVVPLALAGNAVVLLPRDGASEPVIDVRLSDRIGAPIKRGQPVGKLIMTAGNQRTETALVAARDIDKRSWLDLLYDGLRPLIRWVTDSHLF